MQAGNQETSVFDLLLYSDNFEIHYLVIQALSIQDESLFKHPVISNRNIRSPLINRPYNIESNGK